MAEIVLKNMVKRYGDLVAVDHLDLEIKNEEFIVLLGPSGCGKTTTLRCISGLEIPTEGTILIDGQDVTIKPGSERDIAFVFQLYALYPHFTVFKNIAFPLITQGADKVTIKREVESAAKLLRIEHILKKKPKALKRLHVDIGATTVYVTHDQVEAMSMGDRIAIMNLGLLQQVGTPHDIYSNPKNLFVANFIGSPGMNFISCKPVRRNASMLLHIMEVDAHIHTNERISDVILKNREENRELVLGIRPENVLFSLTQKTDYIRTEVFAIEKTGSYNIIDIKLGKELIRVRTGSSLVPRMKDTVYIGFDMDGITLFDRDTEKSIMG
jgi:multiple sugar transport system ATP-binding protein